ncbi:hypothetical protein DIPPA_01493 [Diplonema papillatum]|nr:hypothetical protein DIPPA_01493 [Diplonema papillatum]
MVGPAKVIHGSCLAWFTFAYSRRKLQEWGEQAEKLPSNLASQQRAPQRSPLPCRPAVVYGDLVLRHQLAEEEERLGAGADPLQGFLQSNGLLRAALWAALLPVVQRAAQPAAKGAAAAAAPRLGAPTARHFITQARTTAVPLPRGPSNPAASDVENPAVPPSPPPLEDARVVQSGVFVFDDITKARTTAVPLPRDPSDPASSAVESPAAPHSPPLEDARIVQSGVFVLDDITQARTTAVPPPSGPSDPAPSAVENSAAPLQGGVSVFDKHAAAATAAAAAAAASPCAAQQGVRRHGPGGQRRHGSAVCLGGLRLSARRVQKRHNSTFCFGQTSAVGGDGRPDPRAGGESAEEMARGVLAWRCPECKRVNASLKERVGKKTGATCVRCRRPCPGRHAAHHVSTNRLTVKRVPLGVEPDELSRYLTEYGRVECKGLVPVSHGGSDQVLTATYASADDAEVAFKLLTAHARPSLRCRHPFVAPAYDRSRAAVRSGSDSDLQTLDSRARRDADVAGQLSEAGVFDGADGTCAVLSTYPIEAPSRNPPREAGVFDGTDRSRAVLSTHPIEARSCSPPSEAGGFHGADGVLGTSPNEAARSRNPPGEAGVFDDEREAAEVRAAVAARDQRAGGVTVVLAGLSGGMRSSASASATVALACRSLCGEAPATVRFLSDGGAARAYRAVATFPTPEQARALVSAARSVPSQPLRAYFARSGRPGKSVISGRVTLVQSPRAVEGCPASAAFAVLLGGGGSRRQARRAFSTSSSPPQRGPVHPRKRAAGCGVMRAPGQCRRPLKQDSRQQRRSGSTRAAGPPPGDEPAAAEGESEADCPRLAWAALISRGRHAKEALPLAAAGGPPPQTRCEPAQAVDASAPRTPPAGEPEPATPRLSNVHPERQRRMALGTRVEGCEAQGGGCNGGAMRAPGQCCRSIEPGSRQQRRSCSTRAAGPPPGDAPAAAAEGESGGVDAGAGDCADSPRLAWAALVSRGRHAKEALPLAAPAREEAAGGPPQPARAADASAPPTPPAGEPEPRAPPRPSNVHPDRLRRMGSGGDARGGGRKGAPSGGKQQPPRESGERPSDDDGLRVQSGSAGEQAGRVSADGLQRPSDPAEDEHSTDSLRIQRNSAGEEARRMPGAHAMQRNSAEDKQSADSLLPPSNSAGEQARRTPGPHANPRDAKQMKAVRAAAAMQSLFESEPIPSRLEDLPAVGKPRDLEREEEARGKKRSRCFLGVATSTDRAAALVRSRDEAQRASLASGLPSLIDETKAVVRELRAAEVRALTPPQQMVRSRMPRHSVSISKPHQAVHVACMRPGVFTQALKPEELPEPGDEGGPVYQEWLDSDRAKPRLNAWTWNHELPDDAPGLHRIFHDLAVVRGKQFKDSNLSSLIQLFHRRWTVELNSRSYRYLPLPAEVVTDTNRAFAAALALAHQDSNPFGVGTSCYTALFGFYKNISPTRWVHLYVRFREFVAGCEITPARQRGTDRGQHPYQCTNTITRVVRSSGNATVRVDITGHVSQAFRHVLSASGRSHLENKGTTHAAVWDAFLPIFPNLVARDFESFGFVPQKHHQRVYFMAFADLGNLEKCIDLVDWTSKTRTLTYPRSTQANPWVVPLEPKSASGLAAATRSKAAAQRLTAVLAKHRFALDDFFWQSLATASRLLWHEPDPAFSQACKDMIKAPLHYKNDHCPTRALASVSLGIPKPGLDTTYKGPNSPRLRVNPYK